MNLRKHFARPDGEVVEDQREHRMSFGSAIDRAVVYLMAGLIGWLCLSSLDHGKLLATLVERNTSDRKAIDEVRNEQRTMKATDEDIRKRVDGLELEGARHGWRR